MTMKTLNKQDEVETAFSEILGEELIFFNKDADTDDPFHKREFALEHDDECECLECEKI